MKAISKERIRDEILKALSGPKPSDFFRSLNVSQLLKCILSPLHDCIGVEQGPEHGETVWVHLLLSADASVNLTNNILLRLAALLHDIGKPTTRSINDNGRICFYSHETKGADIARRWMQEYRFSKKEISYVSKIIRWHMYHFSAKTKDKVIKKWLREVGEDWKDLITLRAADRRGNLAKLNRPTVTKEMRELVNRCERLIKSKEPIFNRDLAVSREDLKELDIPPESTNKILRELWAIVLDKPLKNTKENLVRIIRRNYAISR